MSVSTVHVLHGIQNSSTFLSQISSAQLSSGIEYLVSEASGMPYAQFVANLGQNPSTTFDCTQVKTLLDLTGALTSIVDLSGANTDLFMKKVADLGRRTADASAAHLRFRMSQAWLAVERISAGHRQEATASCRLGTTWDGTNNPIVPAGSTALSGTPTSAEHFVAGPVKINTVALPGVQDITIDFGRNILEVGGEGELYNTFAALRSYNPVITIRSLEGTSWTTYGLNGTALTAMSVWLRKVAATGRVADATEEHILFTATAGLITVEDTALGGNQEGMSTIRLTLVGANATTEPITLDTTAAIS